MPVHNTDVAAIFEEIADLLGLDGANEFRIRAYRNAARTLGQLSQPVADLIEAGKDLSELPDIGDDLAGKIETIVKTGTLPLLEELEDKIDPAMVELMDVPGQLIDLLGREISSDRDSNRIANDDITFQFPMGSFNNEVATSVEDFPAAGIQSCIEIPMEVISKLILLFVRLPRCPVSKRGCDLLG